jgi:hypothetical protein
VVTSFQMGEREWDRDGSVSSLVNDASESASHAPSTSTMSTEKSEAQRGIDLLFLRDHERADWNAPRPPEALGELRDSRYMLPLVLPSDPRLLSAVPGNNAAAAVKKSKRESAVLTPNGNGSFVGEERSASRASAAGRGAMAWRSRGRKLRTIGIETLEWVDGVRGLGRWSGGADPGAFGRDEESKDGSEDANGERTEDEEDLTVRRRAVRALLS